MLKSPPRNDFEKTERFPNKRTRSRASSLQRLPLPKRTGSRFQSLLLWPKETGTEVGGVVHPECNPWKSYRGQNAEQRRGIEPNHWKLRLQLPSQCARSALHAASLQKSRLSSEG